MPEHCNSHGEFACKFIPSCQWNDKLWSPYNPNEGPR